MVRVKNLDFLGFENYEVDTEGNVWSLNYNHTVERQMLRPYINSRGYLNVILHKNGNGKCFPVHRLVAHAFIPNPHNLPQVNHKDENKQNNNVTNLEFCDCRYNLNYGTRNERISEALKGENHPMYGKHHTEETIKKLSKPIIGVNIKTGDVVEFDSIKEASITLNISRGHISHCCQGKRKTAGGYRWYYKTPTK